jgi:CCR4-NOT transcription complex subunit 7/8
MGIGAKVHNLKLGELNILFSFSGYDFGYLLSMLSGCNLPSEESDFFELLRIYFPNIYDVKYLMKSCKNLKGGLQEVSEQLEVGNLFYEKLM